MTGLPSLRIDPGRGFGAQPPRDRPIAWSSPALGASAVLMGTHNGAVDHRIFVSASTEVQEDLLPYTRFGPSAEALMHVLPVTEALRQIAHGMPVR